LGKQKQTLQIGTATSPEIDWEVFSKGLLACVGSGVVLADADGSILLSNPALERLFGYEAGELTGKSITMLMPPYEAQHHGAYMRRYLETRQSEFVGQGPREIVAQRKDGTNFSLNITVHPVQMAGVILFVAAMDEPHEEIRGADLDRMAEHDMLTGLRNYHFFQQEVDRVAARTVRGRSEPCALLYIDIDGFRPINDQHGHAEGDRVLVEFARSIERRCRKSDIASRLYADKFAVLLYGIEEKNYREVAESFRSLIQNVSISDGKERVRASAALVPFSRGTDGFKKMLSLAETVCRACKGKGGGTSEIFRAS